MLDCGCLVIRRMMSYGNLQPFAVVLLVLAASDQSQIVLIKDRVHDYSEEITARGWGC